MKTQREFIPQIDVANDEVNRLDGEIVTLRAQLNLPPAVIPPRIPAMGEDHEPSRSTESPVGLTGLARAQAANKKAQTK